MKYKIYNNAGDFSAKNNEITQSGVCGNAAQYADLTSSKHATLNQWAMSVMPYVFGFFNEVELVDELPNDWFVILQKP